MAVQKQTKSVHHRYESAVRTAFQRAGVIALFGAAVDVSLGTFGRASALLFCVFLPGSVRRLDKLVTL